LRPWASLRAHDPQRVQALLDGDARLADSVREMDDEIDRMNRRAHSDLLKLIQEKPQFTQQAMNGILVARTWSGSPTTLRISPPT
jgi:hypothetical protein